MFLLTPWTEKKKSIPPRLIIKDDVFPAAVDGKEKIYPPRLIIKGDSFPLPRRRRGRGNYKKRKKDLSPAFERQGISL